MGKAANFRKPRILVHGNDHAGMSRGEAEPGSYGVFRYGPGKDGYHLGVVENAPVFFDMLVSMVGKTGIRPLPGGVDHVVVGVGDADDV